MRRDEGTRKPKRGCANLGKRHRPEGNLEGQEASGSRQRAIRSLVILNEGRSYGGKE